MMEVTEGEETDEVTDEADELNNNSERHLNTLSEMEELRLKYQTILVSLINII